MPPKVSDDNDDWETDPDFVNDVSEKDQRWGHQKTFAEAQEKAEKIDMRALRENVVTTHNQKSLDAVGDSRRKEYQTPGKDQSTSK